MSGLVGQTVGGYRIVERIGKGGMATVYKAYQPSLDRYVAVKVLPSYYAEQDESFLARFKREARAIAKLRHPNILMVMDYGEERETAYIVMEYVDAGTLKERLGQPLTLLEMSSLIGQISSALDYGHGEGIVHRDVKPSNVLLPKPDWVLLTDFGLAKMVGGSLITVTGMTVGTPAYMSPEQGKGEKVDAHTDIYSLGVVLYEMATGTVPYTAETPMAVVVKHIVDPLPLPRSINPDLPESVERIILKALAKDPNNRFHKAGEIAEALEIAADEHPSWSAVKPAVDPDAVTRVETEIAAELIPDDADHTSDLIERDEQDIETIVQEEPEEDTIAWEEPEVETTAQEDLGEDTIAWEEPEVETIAQEDMGEDTIAWEEPEVETLAQDDMGEDTIAWEEPDVETIDQEEGVSDTFTRDETKPEAVVQEPVSSSEVSDERVDATTAISAGARVAERPVKPSKKRKFLWLLPLAGIFGVIVIIAIIAVVVVPRLFGPDEGQSVDQPVVQNEATSFIEEPTDEPEEEFIPEEEFDDAMAVGHGFLEQGDYENAFREFERGLENNPDLFWEVETIAEELYYTGKVEDAITLANIGLKYNNDPEAYIYDNLGWWHYEIDAPETAMQMFENAFKIDPDLDSAYYGLVSTASEYGLMGHAIDVITEQTVVHPENAIAHSNLAMAYSWIDDYENALGYYEKALELDAGNSWTYLGLADVHQSLDDIDMAIHYTNEANNHAWEDVVLLESIGWKYQDLGVYDAAAGAFERSIEINPDYAWAYIGLAEAFIEMEVEREVIIEQLWKAEELSHDDPWIVTSIGWAFVSLEACERAVEYFHWALEVEPGLEDANDGLVACGVD
jgi:serine/threonine protein kinase/Tfp pilus assembly protein PilF